MPYARIEPLVDVRRDRLEQAMRARDVSGNELARLVGTTPSEINGLRRGDVRRTRVSLARAIEKRLRVPTGSLFGTTDDDVEATG
jgi:transcriptional regulator with XRE-family HTH domain